ncbi:hypothetical protein CEXT_44221 [Caerostris extrusa]|uniref:Uncharacterized protein n=1 Tax=Caerostris extrusa TaxID=172846 RepID=A0AAV4P4X3_CAEEX|nr:hypothetical protein CEXT_44221 [Caerostris extrusa]
MSLCLNGAIKNPYTQSNDLSMNPQINALKNIPSKETVFPPKALQKDVSDPTVHNHLDENNKNAFLKDMTLG